MHGQVASETLAKLRLARTEGVGPLTFKRLLARHGSALEALAALPSLAASAGRENFAIHPEQAATRELAALHRHGGQLLCLGDPLYPKLLALLPDPPPVLSVHGDVLTLSGRSVALVGARNASANGMRVAEALAAELAAAGIVVVSGLARGIDGAAHEGSLASGTVAVLGGGIDVVYPSEHQALQAKIAEHGLLVAESPVHTVPQARHFPRRNRIISGLSLGVLVVEAAVRSGSLITARMALEQGREVFAVPGSPLDPRARGTNDLIRQGATLVESADDVTNVLSGRRLQLAEPGSGGPEAPAAADERELAAARRLVLDKLTYAPVEVDELMRQTGLAPGALLTVLLELELAGRLARHPGNKVALA